MSTIYRFQYALEAADADGICESQTPSAGGEQALVINGAFASVGEAFLDVQRRVIITSAADDTARTFTITGTNDAGIVVSEAVPGADSAAASSTVDFRTVTSVTVDDDTAGAVTVGTSGVGAARMRPFNLYQEPFNVSIGVTVEGTVDYTVQYSFDDPFGRPEAMEWFNHPDLNGKTGNEDGNFAFPVTAARLLLNAGDGTVRVRLIQGG